jgi:hypothetical protein
MAYLEGYCDEIEVACDESLVAERDVIVALAHLPAQFENSSLD